MRRLVLIIHNVRSTHNVGSLLRTADGLGVELVILSGYTPYPPKLKDERLPHLAAKAGRQIGKTSLGAERSVKWRQAEQLGPAISRLRARGYQIAALEQTTQAADLTDYQAPEKIALIVGNEIAGLDDRILELSDIHLQIPMLGAKESFNVAVAGAMALYHLRYN